jgi:hypothetical protein
VSQQNAETSLSTNVFARTEEKYLLESGVSEKLHFLLGSALELDGYGSTLISNIYLDTPDHLLVRRSIEKPDFKEKLRIRTYGNVMNDTHPAFLELKKKYLGTVYKRRVQMTLREALRFVDEGIVPLSPYQGSASKVALNQQIMDEMQWTLEHYGSLQPSLSVTYERCAYTYTSQGSSLRLTLDCNVNWQTLQAPSGSVILREVAESTWQTSRSGRGGTTGLTGDVSVSTKSDLTQKRPLSTLLLPPDTCIMEIKTSGALPLEFTRALNDLKLFPQSFSKVGHAYEAFINKGENQ